MSRTWTRDDGIAYLRAKADETGHEPPTMLDMMPSHMVMVRLFGSIAKAQEAAGFTPRKPGRPGRET